jgi:hypothetical protein
VSRVRKNSLDEMTVRRTEIPVQGERPQKPSLDVMGPGTDRETPMPKTRPHAPSLKETHEYDFIPAPEDKRPGPRSFGGRPGSPVGRGKRRR